MRDETKQIKELYQKELKRTFGADAYIVLKDHRIKMLSDCWKRWQYRRRDAQTLAQVDYCTKIQDRCICELYNMGLKAEEIQYLIMR